MRTDQCAHCGEKIYLIKTSPIDFKWVIDPEKPDQWRCMSTAVHPDRRHAPVSMQESRR